MEHVVFFTGLDSSAHFRRMPSLDEAVRYVESLRNGEGIADSTVFALTEVPLRFQTYYRVEVPAEAVPAAPVTSQPVLDAPESVQPVSEPVVEQLVEFVEVVEAVAAEEQTEPTTTAKAEPVVEELAAPVAESVFAPVAEMPSIEALTAAPALPDTEPANDVVEPSANGKPNRGMGFFAR